MGDIIFYIWTGIFLNFFTVILICFSLNFIYDPQKKAERSRKIIVQVISVVLAFLLLFVSIWGLNYLFAGG